MLNRRRELMANIGGDMLRPVTALVSSTSPIDTGITITDEIILKIRAKRCTEKANAGYMFYDGCTMVTQRNKNYSNESKAFAEAFNPYISQSSISNYIIDGVNHSVTWASKSFTASAFVQATNSVKLAVAMSLYASNGYTYYYITATKNDILIHDLRPYLKNEQPGFYDLITKDFITVAEGEEDWTYIA